MKTRLGYLVAVLTLASVIPHASASVTVTRVSSPSPFPIGDCFPNDRVFFDDGPGSETDPSIAINPTNPANIVAAWISDTAYGIVTASSFDGGQTWTRTPVSGLTRCTGGTAQHILHARLSFGGDGRLYLAGETLNGFFPDPRSFITRIPVVTSIDGGLTWSPPSRVDDLPIAGGFDRLAAEPDTPGAAVVVWHGPEGAATSYLSRTTDGGATWTKHRLPNPAPEFQPFQSVLAAPDGALYVFYSDRTLLATLGALSFGALSFQTNVYAVRSDDKGATWSAPRRVVANVEAQWVATAATPDGAIYMSTWRGPDGSRELIVMRSDDRGETWSEPMVAATNVLAPFPLVAADSLGSLGVTYMTPTPEGTTAAFARSVDGGATWTQENVAGPFPASAFGYYQETAGGPSGFASVFIRSGSDTDGPTDVFVAVIT